MVLNEPLRLDAPYPFVLKSFAIPFPLLNTFRRYTCWYVLCLSKLMWSKSTSLIADTIASIVDTSFKYFMVICDPVPVLHTICCSMSLKASSFNIPSTSSGDGDFHYSNSLLDTLAPMFKNFSPIDSTFVWKIVLNTFLCKHIDWK